jgi:hypothetical protein
MVGEFLDGGLGETAELDTVEHAPQHPGSIGNGLRLADVGTLRPEVGDVCPLIWAATSNAHSVRVDAFSKISAKFLPASPWSSEPSCLARLSQAAVAR